MVSSEDRIREDALRRRRERDRLRRETETPEERDAKFKDTLYKSYNYEFLMYHG